MGEELTRCFIAIKFPDEIIKEIARVQGVLGKRVFQGKLTEIENLHLTLKFLGEISEEKVLKVRKKLREIKFNEFSAKLMGAGTFNTADRKSAVPKTFYGKKKVSGIRGNPRIVWIKVGGESIFKLQEKIDGALEGCGFKKEERFMSHLTIARVKYVKDKKGFLEYVSNIGVKESEFKVSGFNLMKSELRTTGPVYNVIEGYGLEEDSTGKNERIINATN